MTLQEEMLAYRARHNFSQSNAAALAEITLQTWNQVERGIQTPSRLTEQKIRQLFKRDEEEQ